MEVFMDRKSLQCVYCVESIPNSTQMYRMYRGIEFEFFSSVALCVILLTSFPLYSLSLFLFV